MSRKPSIYYTEGTMGCTLTAANSSKQALKQIADDMGRNNIRVHRLATVDDIAWVKSMGGGAGLEGLI